MQCCAYGCNKKENPKISELRSDSEDASDEETAIKIEGSMIALQIAFVNDNKKFSVHPVFTDYVFDSLLIIQCIGLGVC